MVLTGMDVQALYGLELVRWPEDAILREHLARAGIPRLLLVGANAEPPLDLAANEDWVHWPASDEELESRARRLAQLVLERRAERAWIEPNRVVHRGAATVVLTAAEAVAATALLDEPGDVVARSRLESLLWPDGPPPSPRALDAVMYRLRRRLGALGLIVRAARNRGFQVTTDG